MCSQYAVFESAYVDYRGETPQELVIYISLHLYVKELFDSLFYLLNDFLVCSLRETVLVRYGAASLVSRDAITARPPKARLTRYTVLKAAAKAPGRTVVTAAITSGVMPGTLATVPVVAAAISALTLAMSKPAAWAAGVTAAAMVTALRVDKTEVKIAAIRGVSYRNRMYGMA